MTRWKDFSNSIWIFIWIINVNKTWSNYLACQMGDLSSFQPIAFIK